MVLEFCGFDKNADSSCSTSVHMARYSELAYSCLARRQNSAHFAHNRLITAKIRVFVKDKAQVESEVIAAIPPFELSREPNYPMVACGELYQAAI